MRVWFLMLQLFMYEIRYIIYNEETITLPKRNNAEMILPIDGSNC